MDNTRVRKVGAVTTATTQSTQSTTVQSDQVAASQPMTPVASPPQQVIYQQPPVQQIVYQQYEEKGKGCGCFSTLFWKLFTCLGCLLLILAIIIVAFIVWVQL